MKTRKRWVCFSLWCDRANDREHIHDVVCTVGDDPFPQCDVWTSLFSSLIVVNRTQSHTYYVFGLSIYPTIHLSHVRAVFKPGTGTHWDSERIMSLERHQLESLAHKQPQDVILVQFSFNMAFNYFTFHSPVNISFICFQFRFVLWYQVEHHLQRWAALRNRNKVYLILNDLPPLIS